MTNGSLMKVKSIAECSPWSILQYFWPALSDNWSWKPIFGLSENGHFTQVLLYKTCVMAAQKDTTKIIITNDSLMLVKSIAEWAFCNTFDQH